MIEALIKSIEDLEKKRPKEHTWPAVEAQLAELERLRAAYAAGPAPYAVGDYVTPRAGVNLRGGGQPHLVVEVRRTADALRRCDAEISDADFAGALTLRMGRYNGRYGACFWVEAWQVEPWHRGRAEDARQPDDDHEDEIAAMRALGKAVATGGRTTDT